VYDVERDTLTQFDLLEGIQRLPGVDAVCNHLAFSSTVEGTESIYWIRAGGG
jgi:hypothetical protein